MIRFTVTDGAARRGAINMRSSLRTDINTSIQS